MDFAKTIAELRAEKNLSQDELAERLFVSRDLISKWESGTRRPDWAMIEKIADVLEVSPSQIADKNELVFRELEACLPDHSGFTVEELVPLLNSFLEDLNETEANLFLNRYYFLKNPSQIALLFGIKENCVRSILSRTRKKLKKYLKEVKHGKQKAV